MRCGKLVSEMPEGDTIRRTATTLARWLGGRTITASRNQPWAERIVGATVDGVDAHGKHLLIALSNGLEVHSHMRMTGSWHVYPAGAKWQRSPARARLVLEAADRVAVCFDAPIVELLVVDPRIGSVATRHLGPDILVEPLDWTEIWGRARLIGGSAPPSLRSRSLRHAPEAAAPQLAREAAPVALGELLLDQRVAAGIGNVYRNEAMFLTGHHPWLPVNLLTEADLRDVYTTAAALMIPNLRTEVRRGVGGAAARTPAWVYRRAGRPCRTCGTPVRSRPQGAQARIAYWCPTCQPDHRRAGGYASG